MRLNIVTSESLLVAHEGQKLVCESLDSNRMCIVFIYFAGALIL